jgi:hypothetical protein
LPPSLAIIHGYKTVEGLAESGNYNKIQKLHLLGQ